MYPYSKHLFTGLLVLLCYSVWGQVKSEITHYSTKDGLSHDGVICIARDREGFMWFGTFDGLNRFDGHNFKIYKSHPGDSSILRSNKIRDIVEDRAGYLWIETFDYRIYRFDKTTEQFLPIFEGPYKRLFTDQVITNKIIPDARNGIWLLTRNTGTYHVQSSRNQAPVVTRYTTASAGGQRLKGNVVQFHYTDSAGRIWIGTEGGLNLLKPSQQGGYRVSPFNAEARRLFSSAAFTCAAQRGNLLYFGTANGRLLVYNMLRQTVKTLPVSTVRINALCISRRGDIYISTAGRGLMRFNQCTGKAVYITPGSKAIYLSLYEDRAGRIWIEPEKDGIAKYDPQTGKIKLFYQQRDYTAASRDYRVVTDPNGTLWMSMKGGGFGNYNPETDHIDYYFDEPGSPAQQFSNVVTCLHIDKTGVLWMSGKDGGINKIVPITDKFNFAQPVAQPRSRSENDVRAMMQDSRGRLWVCTKDGLVRVYQQNREVQVFAGGDNRLGFVYALLEDSHGNVWLGTKGSGLVKAAPQNAARSLYSIHRFRNNPQDATSVSNDMIYSIMEDSKGRLWVGTYGGGLNQVVNVKGHETFKNRSNTFHSYPFSWGKVIRHLLEDNSGHIWIATTNGLLVFNPDAPTAGGDYHFKAYKKIPGNRQSLGNNSVQYIAKDNTGQLWLGTFGGGISKVIIPGNNVEHAHFQAITMANGLPNDVVLSMAVDHHNDLWIATAGGLAKFNPKTGTFKSYDPFDGLTKTGFSEATCFTAPNGTVYFGCLNGYVSFNPKNIVSNQLPGNLALTNIQLYYKDIQPGADGSPLKQTINATHQLMLNNDQNVISIDYAVLDYRAPHKIAYAYKLENFDKTWHTVNDLTKAVYTNLPPGSYTFRVRGISEDLLSNVPEKMLHIVIKSPFYATWWAYLLYTALLGLAALLARNIIVTMIRLRNKVVVEQKLTEVKLSFFTNISHELRTPLTLIASPLEELSHNEKLSDKGREYFKIINRNVNRLIRFTNQLLDFRKVQNGKMQIDIAETDLATLLTEVGSYFTTAAEEKHIDFKIRIHKAQTLAWVDAEKIEIILYNLLSNAFKFSPPHKKITLELQPLPAEGLIHICVTDEGKGVQPDHLEDIFEIYHEEHQPGEKHLKGTGIGLALARGLAESHKGRLWAELNTDGPGITFILELRTGNSHFRADELTYAHQQATIVQLPQFELAATSPALPTPPVDVHPALVLIVEDNPDLRAFLENKLNSFYQVLTAADGAEGLKIARSAYPDLVISDVVMPEMDGIQMLDAIKHDASISHIPVILLTAKSSVESRIRGLKYGADVYLTKPFNNDLLMASIENLLTSRKRLFERFADVQREKEVRLSDELLIPVTTSRDEEFLKAVINIVEEKLGDQNFNIDEVASGMGMGRTTFYKKLKSLSALSPVEFVRELRLKRSKQILDGGAHTVSEAGYMAGFNSQAYFSTCFKEKYQISPSVYLKNIKAKSV